MSHGASKTGLFCLGHSHIECVQKAAERDALPIDSINFWQLPGGPFGQVDDLGNPRFVDHVAQRIYDRVGPIFSLLGGNAYGTLGLLRHPRPFDFVLPSEPGLPLDSNCEVVPTGAVITMIEQLSHPWLGLLRELARLGVGPLFHLEPPPPSEDSDHLRAVIPRHTRFFPRMVPQLSPQLFRYKLWRLHSRIAAEACAQLGVEFVPVPADVQNPNGFLEDRYFDDGLHANVDYGARMIELMESLS